MEATLRISVLFSVAAIALAGAPAAQARDLLAPSNIGHPVARIMQASWTMPAQRPFTTTYGRSGNVCSISGLGHTSHCVMLSWPQREAMRPGFAIVAD
jgi:hypothetical protein